MKAECCGSWPTAKKANCVALGNVKNFAGFILCCNENWCESNKKSTHIILWVEESLQNVNSNIISNNICFYVGKRASKAVFNS